MRIQVRIIPNAHSNEIVGKESGVYKIRLAAPPIDGRANETLIRFLADRLEIAPSLISIVKGHTSKHKTLEIPLPPEEVTAALSPAAFC